MEDLTIAQLEAMIVSGSYTDMVNATIELNARLCCAQRVIKTYKRIGFLEDARKVQETMTKVQSILDLAQ